MIDGIGIGAAQAIAHEAVCCEKLCSADISCELEVDVAEAQRLSSSDISRHEELHRPPFHDSPDIWCAAVIEVAAAWKEATRNLGPATVPHTKPIALKGSAQADKHITRQSR